MLIPIAGIIGSYIKIEFCYFMGVNWAGASVDLFVCKKKRDKISEKIYYSLVMSGLLIWKILGYGLIIMVVGGIVISILSAAFTILVYASMPFLAVGFLGISIFTFPITYFLRRSGRNSRSFFEVGIEAWKRWHTPYDQSEPEKARYDWPKSEQHTEYREQKTQKDQQSTEDAFDPWKILGIEPRASKQTIAAAFRKKGLLGFQWVNLREFRAQGVMLLVFLALNTLHL